VSNVSRCYFGSDLANERFDIELSGTTQLTRSVRTLETTLCLIERSSLCKCRWFDVKKVRLLFTTTRTPNITFPVFFLMF
jgi:hypothetical protein